MRITHTRFKGLLTGGGEMKKKTMLAALVFAFLLAFGIHAFHRSVMVSDQQSEIENQKSEMSQPPEPPPPEALTPPERPDLTFRRN